MLASWLVLFTAANTESDTPVITPDPIPGGSVWPLTLPKESPSRKPRDDDDAILLFVLQ